MTELATVFVEKGRQEGRQERDVEVVKEIKEIKEMPKLTLAIQS